MKRLKLLFVPSVYVGHIVAGLGLAQALIDRQHSVIYAIPKKRHRFVQNENISIENVDIPLMDEAQQADDLPFLYKKLFQFELTINYLKVLLFFMTQPLRLTYKCLMKDILLRRVIERTEPDLIVVDDIIRYPSVINSGIPLIYVTSSNPRYNDIIDRFENLTLSKSPDNYSLTSYIKPVRF